MTDIKAFRGLEDAPARTWIMPDTQRLLVFDGQRLMFRSQDAILIAANSPRAFEHLASVEWTRDYSPKCLYRTANDNYVVWERHNFRGSVDDRLEALPLEQALAEYARLPFHAPGGWDAAFDGTQFGDA